MNQPLTLTLQDILTTHAFGLEPHMMTVPAYMAEDIAL